VLTELRRNQLAELKAQRFNSRANSHEQWTKGKDALLQQDDYSTANLGSIIALKKKHEGFQSELAAHEAWVSEIGTLANELDTLHYYDSNAVNERYATIYANWEELVRLTQERQHKLEEAEKKQIRVDELYLQFAHQAPIFIHWLDSSKSQVTDPYIAETENDVKVLQEAHTQFKADLPQHENTYHALKGINDELASLGANPVNPYSTHSFETITKEFNDLKTLIQKRDQTYSEEAKKQAAREQLRRDWASAANTTNQWITSKLNAVKKELEGTVFDKLEGRGCVSAGCRDRGPELPIHIRLAGDPARQGPGGAHLREPPLPPHHRGAPWSVDTNLLVHPPQHHRVAKPDPHARFQAHQRGEAARVPRLVQALRQGWQQQVGPQRVPRLPPCHWLRHSPGARAWQRQGV